MSPRQEKAVRAMLANDEASSDADLMEHFIINVGLTTEEAEKAVAERGQYLRGIKS